jgi:O-antigen/teichoic acid export membrane protein
MSERRRLDHALLSGVAWTALFRWLAQAASWIATLLAARMLQPGDYGILSMAMIPIGMVRMVEDFGLDSILVQDRSIAGERQARLAGFVLMMGTVLCGLFLLLAVPIASFFKEPQLASVVALLSVLFLTDALQVIPRAGLQRTLQFRRLAIALFLQVLVTQGVLLLAASSGWGVWSLVVNSIAGAVAVTTLLAIWHPFSIRWPKDLRDLARPLLQGWRIMASRFAYWFYTTADQTIIGRVLGKDSLGAYSFATTFSTVAMQEVGSVVSRVVPGIFSQTQHRREELRRYFLTLTELLSYLTLPATIGLALTAELFVHAVLGPQWEGVIAPLRLLCLFAAFSSAQVLVSHVMLWTGQFRAVMWCTVLTAVTLPLAFLIGVRYGLAGVALAWAVVYPLTNLPPLVIAFRTIAISFLDWFEALRPAVLSCIVMSVAVFGTSIELPAHTTPLFAFAACITVGAITYVATLWFAFGRRVMGLVNEIRAARVQATGAADAPASVG